MTTTTTSSTTAPSSTTTTTTASSTTTAPPETTEAAADFDISVDTDTEWGQVFEGQQYELDATLGTLHFSRLDLNDADGNRLTGYEDYGESTSRLIWNAPATGTYHVQVHGFGASTGTYTLTIAPS